MAQYDSFDYTRIAKGGFLLGVALLFLGAGGEIIGHIFFDSLPAWENTLFVYAEGLGILLGFFSPLIFGIVLPLTSS